MITFFTFLSCDNLEDNQSVTNKTNEAIKDSIVSPDSFQRDNPEVSNNKPSELHGCQFEEFANDTSTPKLAKDIYLDNEWDLSNDIEALALLDSLTAKDKFSRPFYFKIITKTYEKSDGYFSEGLGYVGKEFVESNTKEFAAYFDDKECFSDDDLTTWGKIVMMEFELIADNKPNKSLMHNYVNELKTNCQDCSIIQKEIIDKFCLILNQQWKEILEYIDS